MIEKKNPVGRPLKDGVNRQTMSFRFLPSTIEKIKKNAESFGMTYTEYVEQIINGG